MRFVKRKIASAVLAGLMLIPGESHAGFPVVDFPQIPPAVMENIRKANETYAKIGQYLVWIDTNVNSYLVRIETTIGVKFLDNRVKTELTEDIHNLKVAESTLPLPDICKKIIAKPSPKTKAATKQYVSEFADHYAHGASTSYTKKINTSGKVSEISDEESASKTNYLNAAYNYTTPIASNMKALRPDLTKNGISDSEKAKLAEESVENPMATQGDYIMNPSAFFILEPKQQIAMQDMIKLIVPPVMNPDGTPEVVGLETVEEMVQQTKRSMISSTLSGNLAKRIPNEDGVSELSLINEYDASVFSGKPGEGVANTLVTRLGTETLTLTKTPMLREQVLLTASQVHFSVEEFKENMERESLKAMELLEKVNRVSK